MTFDIQKLADALRAAAKAEIMPRFKRLGEADIRAKSEASDLVTKGDEAAERFLKREVAALLPEAFFVGEESVAADPALLQALPDADLAVVVDPIDGTANFVAGLPLFGVMAAVCRRGEAIAGILYDPLDDDWILAEKGGGAFLRRPNGESTPVRVAEPVPLAQMVGYASTGFLPAGSKARILANLAKPRLFASLRCAAHEYRAFASGHGHFLMYSKLNPWDHLAGTLIAAEAGAHVACFDGSHYDAREHTDGLLLATDRESWEVLMQEVFG